MAPTVLEANCDLDVTISLVDKSSMEEPTGSRRSKKKRRRTSVGPPQVAHGNQVGKVKVKASRLRQCSTYFDTCMSERWARSKVPEEMKLLLEVQTEVWYYEDCFSRMNYLYKPIASVACCIELLKVASQIGFQALMDIGVKYLGGTAWSDEEEKLVREFCTSAHLVPFDSLTDLLSTRFHHLPLAPEEQQEKLSLNAKNLLSRYLQYALPEKSLSLPALPSQSNSRRKFASAFKVVMSGVESGFVCDEVQEHVQALLTKALANLLTRAQRELKSLFAMAFAGEGVLSDICWLFEVAREANAAQALVVELLGKLLVVTQMLLSTPLEPRHFRLIKVRHSKQWAKIIYALFQDVLEGKLFLDARQRVMLFRQWLWLTREKFSSLNKELLSEIHVKFVTTLPQMEQEIFWMNPTIELDQVFLREAHRIWISRMVTRKAQVLQQQPTALTNEVRSKSQD